MERDSATLDLCARETLASHHGPSALDGGWALEAGEMLEAQSRVITHSTRTVRPTRAIIQAGIHYSRIPAGIAF